MSLEAAMIGGGLARSDVTCVFELRRKFRDA